MTDQIYIFPTDTVWGIGGSLRSRVAQKRIEAIKHITQQRPYALIFAQLHDLAAWMTPASPLYARNELVRWADILAAHTTLLFPRAWLKDDAQIAAPGGSHIGVRWQPNEAIKKIWQIEHQPIISTSLNLSGQTPIIREGDARVFAQQFAPDAQFFNAPIAGQTQASTILRIDQVTTSTMTSSSSSSSSSSLQLEILRGQIDGHLGQILASMGLNVDGN